jgi:hypothetical protein
MDIISSKIDKLQFLIVKEKTVSVSIGGHECELTFIEADPHSPVNPLK